MNISNIFGLCSKNCDLKTPLSNTGSVSKNSQHKLSTVAPSDGSLSTFEPLSTKKSLIIDRDLHRQRIAGLSALQIKELAKSEKWGDENYTDSSFIGLCRDFLGEIQLDYFSCYEANLIVNAGVYFTKENSALTEDCSKYLKKFANPPYSKYLVAKCVQKVLSDCHIGETLMLVNTSSSVGWYRNSMARCSAFLFVDHRMDFDCPYRDPDDKTRNRYDQTLFYFGDRSLEFAKHFQAFGEVGFPYKKYTAPDLELSSSVQSKRSLLSPPPLRPDEKSPLLSQSLAVDAVSKDLLIKYAGGLDWLQGVFSNISKKEKDHIIGEIQNIFKDAFDLDKDKPFFSGRQFAHSLSSSRGAKIAWNILEGTMGARFEVWIMIPAGVLSGNSQTYLLLRFLRTLDKLRFRPTRLDFCIDDFTKSLDIDLFKATYNAGLSHGFDDMWEYSKQKKQVAAGRTLYLGSPTSDKLVRLYEKYLESAGAIDSMRLEAQLKDDYCRDAFRFILSTTEQTFSQMCVNIAINCIDFYVGDRNDKIRAKWWQDFHDSVSSSPIKLSCGRIKDSIDRSMDWCKNGGVFRVLATVREFYDHTTSDYYEWLDAGLDYGRSLITSAHRAQILAACAIQGIDPRIPKDDLLDGFF